MTAGANGDLGAADVVVIGAGVAGAADAFFLAREGLDVLVIERASQPASLTTARSAACFRAQASRDDFAELVVESIEFYRSFGEHVGLPGWDIGMREDGWLFLLSTADGPERCSRFVEHNRRLGVTDSEAWPPAQIVERFPWVSENVTAATFRARDGWLSPNEVVDGFLRASATRLSLDTDVTGIAVEHGRVTGVATSKGTVRTGKVVVSCGPFSGRVASLAGAGITVLPVRRQIAVIADCPEVPDHSPMVADAETHAYWRPEGAGALLSVTRHEPSGEPSLAPEADWTYAAEALEGNARLSPFWEKVAEGLLSENVHTLAGQYTCTSDLVPLIGAIDPIGGLFTHTGDNGWGVESAPAAARRLADAVVGRPNESLARFSPGRHMTPRRIPLASNWP
jgi:sarcosine oxidase subunit beta